MIMKKILYCIILMLPLTGCSSKHWAKPGASQYDTSNAHADCATQSYEKHPVKMQQSVNLDLRSLSKDNPMNSLKIDENDINKEAREAFITSCMYKKGWMLTDK
ncbi:hypothetical protein A4J19_25380 [Salmonella enterica subsp. enterica serovar Oranienburg]|uniref:Lipoprotein n=2 Tax=Salmonella enterica TaxID=28901 RepID=A0A3R0YJD5_SALET|nr:hypothetical protein [Salmonella enterica subsp. enterica serovar Oranienburg]MIP07173.1 hypothetical protein [Salmonella enterica subsp. enterica serovar Oranienburg]MLU99933.1 hypothetical protein [Salmonella enterica subsp. enterica serovar Oranienburg]